MLEKKRTRTLWCGMTVDGPRCFCSAAGVFGIYERYHAFFFIWFSGFWTFFGFASRLFLPLFLLMLLCCCWCCRSNIYFACIRTVHRFDELNRRVNEYFNCGCCSIHSARVYRRSPGWLITTIMKCDGRRNSIQCNALAWHAAPSLHCFVLVLIFAVAAHTHIFAIRTSKMHFAVDKRSVLLTRPAFVMHCAATANASMQELRLWWAETRLLRRIRMRIRPRAKYVLWHSLDASECWQIGDPEMTKGCHDVRWRGDLSPVNIHTCNCQHAQHSTHTQRSCRFAIVFYS